MRNLIVRPLTLSRLTARLIAIAVFAALLSVVPFYAALASHDTFAVLGGTAVTCTNSTVIGDVGVDLGGAFTPTSCTVSGIVHVGDTAAQNAYDDFLLDYAALATVPACDSIMPADNTSAVLTPGVYCSAAAVTQTGTTWTLSGLSTDTWIFRIGTSTTGALTGTNFTVVMPGGAPCDNNVSWWTAQAATLTDSVLIGSILAGTSITVTGGSLDGQALAKAAVTLTGTSVCGPAPQQPGSIITIVKDAVPNDARDFAYTTTGTGLSPFSLDDDGNANLPNTITFTGLAAGPYSVTETLPVAGFALTGLSCTDPTGGTTTSVSSGTASIDLDADETVTCTYTNTKDTTKPTCTTTKGVDGDGKRYIEVTVQDTQSGLYSIRVNSTVTNNNNAVVTVTGLANPAIGFENLMGGTTLPVVVRATLNSGSGLQLQMTVKDVAGNSIACDPVILVITRENGKPLSTTVNGVPAVANKVTITNGTPGVKVVKIEVNGIKFSPINLKDGQEVTLDVTSAMKPDEMKPDDNNVFVNVFVVTVTGKPGGEVEVTISD